MRGLPWRSDPARWVALITLGLVGAAAAGAPYQAPPGPAEVATITRDWRDARRHRVVPVRLYYPQSGATPWPVVLFSHGLGGTRDGYAYLGRHWASHGYLAVHLQHVGSDDSVWRGKADALEALRATLKDPRHALNRPLDVTFALDQIERLNREDPLFKGRLALDQIGLAGHSFGAFTTLASCGQAILLPGQREVRLTDARLKAGIAMSPPAPAQRDQLDEIFAQVRVPLLHLTGTRDDSPVHDTKASERRLPYDHLHHCDQYLVTFAGGDHLVFSGRPRALPGGERDQQLQEYIKQGTTMFWNAYLRGDAAALKWLTEGGYAGLLGAAAKLELKRQAAE